MLVQLHQLLNNESRADQYSLSPEANNLQGSSVPLYVWNNVRVH